MDMHALLDIGLLLDMVYLQWHMHDTGILFQILLVDSLSSHGYSFHLHLKVYSLEQVGLLHLKIIGK